MASTTEVPRTQWVSFFDKLSHSHADELVRIEVLRRDTGAHLEVNDLPLDGISADVAGDATITIEAGNPRDRHISHVISDPVSVRIARSSAGEDDALMIADAEQTVTLVFFDEPISWPGRA